MASDMCLHTHIDVSYLSFPRSRSRAGGHVFLSDKLKPGQSPAECAINGHIHVICKIIKFAMISSRIRDRRGIHDKPRKCTNAHMSGGNGTPTTANFHPSRQRNGSRICKQDDQTKMVKSHIYEVLLAARQVQPRKICHLLGTRSG